MKDKIAALLEWRATINWKPVKKEVNPIKVNPHLPLNITRSV